MENKNDNIIENNVNDTINDTKEINLDELYDGSINNTVVIDPVTNSEILIENKKTSIFFIILLIIIIVSLLLYFIKMKTPIGNTTKAVVPITTTTSKIITTTNNITEKVDNLESGILICDYNMKTNEEEQISKFTANYKDSKITKSIFNLDVISLIEPESNITTTLKNEYENFYINNASLEGANVTFIKNEKGFNFNIQTNYENVNFDLITLTEGQTNLYVKSSTNDTYDSLKQNYESKGYKCSIEKSFNE